MLGDVELPAVETDAVDLGTVTLEPGVRLEGRVVDPDGRPSPGLKSGYVST